VLAHRGRRREGEGGRRGPGPESGGGLPGPRPGDGPAARGGPRAVGRGVSRPEAPHMRQHCPEARDWMALLEGAAPEDRPDLASHLDTCTDCQRTVDVLAADRGSWEEAAAGLGPEGRGARAPALQRVMDRLKEEGPTVAPEGEAPAVDEAEVLASLHPAD